MSDQNEGPLDITMDTTNAVVAIPQPADGVMARWKIVKISKVLSKEQKPMLKFEYDLVNPVASTEGQQIEPGKPGSKHFENIALFDKNTTPPEIPKWAITKVSQRIDAALGTGDKGNLKGKPERPGFPACADALIGKELIAKMKAQTGDFVGSEFATVRFPGDIQP